MNHSFFNLKPNLFGIAMLILAGGCLGEPVKTDSPSNDGSLSLIVENDTFTGSDNNYTNGLGLSWTSNEIGRYPENGFIRKWAEFWSFLPFFDSAHHQTYVSWTLGQEMHSPNDITLPDPPLDDQPYAGILFIDSSIHTRKGRWGHVWNLRLGTVGPASGADQIQTEFHEITGSDIPRGWDTQLPDEPILNITFHTGYLLVEDQLGTATWRIVPLGSLSLGNHATAASFGAYAEIGWNLPDAMALCTLRGGLNTAFAVGGGPQDSWSISFFLGINGFGVAHYMPLDGTVFRDSRSVESNPFIGVISAGMSIRRGRFAASLGTSAFTETFASEREDIDYGTLGMAWYY